MSKGSASRYDEIISAVFFEHHTTGAAEVPFDREACVKASQKLGMPRIKNLGDIMYSYRFRRELPEPIRRTAPKGKEWIILGCGIGKYQFRLARAAKAAVAENRPTVKIPDGTPEIVKLYMAGRDEQALLTRIRYNRVLDLFTGLTCYSVQNHLRTTVPGVGQIEVDEVYLGVGKSGAHFVLPCQAKSPGDQFGIAQVLQDTELCRTRYPNVLCRPIALQFTDNDAFAVLEFMIEDSEQGLSLVVVDERHFQFVLKDELSEAEIERYVERELLERERGRA